MSNVKAISIRSRIMNWALVALTEAQKGNTQPEQMPISYWKEGEAIAREALELPRSHPENGYDLYEKALGMLGACTYYYGKFKDVAPADFEKAEVVSLRAVPAIPETPKNGNGETTH